MPPEDRQELLSKLPASADNLKPRDWRRLLADLGFVHVRDTQHLEIWEHETLGRFSIGMRSGDPRASRNNLAALRRLINNDQDDAQDTPSLDYEEHTGTEDGEDAASWDPEPPKGSDVMAKADKTCKDTTKADTALVEIQVSEEARLVLALLQITPQDLLQNMFENKIADLVGRMRKAVTL